MSNLIVGSVYQTIIEKVIAASKNGFDEFGVDQSTLEEMKQGWQDKLSELKIANFPWDPQPEVVRAPTLPSNVKTEAEFSPAIPAPHDQPNFPSIPIKTERGYEPPLSAYPPAPPNYTGGYNGDIAQQRAHALVAQRLNQQAPHGMQMPHPQHSQMYAQQRMMPQAQQRPVQPHPQQQHQQHAQHPQHPQAQQYQQQQQPQQPQQPQQSQQQQQQQMPPQMQQRPPPNHLYTSQTDGADEALDEWKAMVAARRAAESEDPEGRAEADRLMRTHMEAMMAPIETGLGMPLKQMPKGKKSQAINRVRQEKMAEESARKLPTGASVAQLDGELEEEEKVADEDAINSDLDDPEDDDAAGDGSDDEMIDYMLCTYDKVQRVKNKWKCTLKDGILTTNKKEYLFHKANGEFEW